jgi:hypothetical protein
MYRIQIGKGIYTYLVGNHTIAIIPPNKKKWIKVTHDAIHEAAKDISVIYIQNGTADGRIAPEEIVAYVVKHQIA